MAIKISFLAPSCFGKSTAVKILKDHFSLKTIKLAEPLYKLQSNFYETINRPIGDKQDGELLLFLGEKIRQEHPDFLHKAFLEKLKIIEQETNLILNDDCRPHSYKYMKSLGFNFVKINGYNRDRNDHIPIDREARTEWKEDIPFDFKVDNLGTIEEYRNNLLKLINEIIFYEQEKGNSFVKKRREYYDIVRK